MNFSRVSRLFSLAALVLLLPSCSFVASRLAMLEGGAYASRGLSREALAAYLRAGADASAAPYAQYALGCVYLELGETEAAVARFAEAEELSAATSPDRELAYRARYNGGVARFRAGDISAAAAYFKRALEADGSRKEAKRNLELCQRLLARRKSSAASAAPAEDARSPSKPNALFDFIREKESDKWKSREWKAESRAAADY
ncbi:MAG: hypothetical protein A2413_03495 [Treponema sp. RIFOXYC1_FULL_61_9]|nr:MAG: hypothetical protein A2413_03495 [Treponema sp. RIFOXYC1_FULL_61_9]